MVICSKPKTAIFGRYAFGIFIPLSITNAKINRKGIAILNLIKAAVNTFGPNSLATIDPTGQDKPQNNTVKNIKKYGVLFDFKNSNALIIFTNNFD